MLYKRIPAGMRNLLLQVTAGCLLFCASNPLGAQSWKELEQRASVLNLEQGSITFQSPSFKGQLVSASQTLSALHPHSDTSFDFTPGDRLKARSSKGMYHMGDLNLRLRRGTSGNWKYYSTASDRKPVIALPVKAPVIAAADLSSTLPGDIPLSIKRSWQLDKGQLILSFELTNRNTEPIEIGSLGIPLIFNNILEGNTLVQAHSKNVLYDPYIGRDAGYLQVTRLHGRDSSLLVLPYSKTPFEAYNPLNEDPTPRGVAFEGFYEWMVYSKAYAENEWKTAEPWNQPTSVIVQPGQTKTYGLRFVLAGPPATIEKTLVQNKRPVAVGIPGYVLPQDVNGSLFINHKSPVKNIVVEPAGALTIGAAQTIRNGWKSYAVKGNNWGRARVTIQYNDGLVQTVHYKVIKPESQTVADYGNFSLTKQWFEKEGDPFGRSPSVITYDNERKQQVVEDSRAWVSGLSDEGGAGSWLGAVMKQSVLPNKAEVDKLQRFIDETMWGDIQVSEGPTKFGVRKSVFYYEPDSMPAGTYKNEVNLKSWTFWRKKDAGSLGRSYNYPHVAAAHWVMYRLARHHQGMVTSHAWNWYLDNAYQTAMAMVRFAPQYAEFGQMEGTIFFLLLKDLKTEGKSEMASALEAAMKKRMVHWASLAYPFGSEMPWDSTGQEEVYIWSLFFGYEEKAAVTLNAILAYMPTLPHWAYNGNARRYWDFLYAGGIRRVERMIHHYGSPLNAIPVLTEYQRSPDDFYLLRVGYGGVLGALSNITEEGFAPCAFHSYPSTLKNDPLSGDYGSGFFGYAVNSATYLVQHPDFGWLAFGGNVSRNNQWIDVLPTTAGKASVYVAPAGVLINLKAGQVKKLSYQPATGQVKIQLGAADQYTPKAIMTIAQPALANRYNYKVRGGVKTGGQYEIDLTKQGAEVVLERVAK